MSGMDKSLPSPPPIQRRHLKQTALSFSQESLWFLQQLDPENIAYNSSFLYKFSGELDRLSLEVALNEMVQRHESLRTIFPNQRGKPVQVVQPFAPFSLPLMDYSLLPEDEQQLAILKYITDLGNKPYKLQQGPLVRFALMHCAADENYLFFGIHHINSDAWSREIFFSDLLKIYDDIRSGREPALPELSIQYSDYALWQREWLNGDTLAKYIDHWKTILSGDLPILELPMDRPRPVMQTFRGRRYDFRLSPNLSARIKEFCRKVRITPFHLFLAAYAVMLSRYTGLEDIIIGCPFANRSRSELDGLVGMFVNTLPIRLNLQGNPVFLDFLNQVRTVMLDAFAWQAAPFEAVVSDISPHRDLSHTPVFQVAINMRNVPKGLTSIAGLEVEDVPKEEISAPFDLSLDFDQEDGGWAASWVYNVDLFDEFTVIQMVAHYQNLLGELLEKPNQPISELKMLSPSEWKRVVLDWNQTGKDFPQVCVHELIAEQVTKSPEAIAVLFDDVSVTYGDLEKKANQFAQYLQANGVMAESRVGVYLPRSEKTIISLLGILKAGGAYVPLDLTYPPERIAYMVANSDPAAILTLSHLQSQLPDRFKKICLDTEADSISSCAQGAPSSGVDNNALAYVMYTSGSTGRPKGSMNLHKGIVNYLTNAHHQFQMGASDRVIQHTSLSFDASVLEIFGTLSCGGTVFLMDDAHMRNPDFIYSAIIEHQATYITAVPTMLRALCKSASALERKQNSLRLIFPGGEVLRVGDVEAVRQAFGKSVRVVNQYGPTETTVSPTNYLVPEVLPNDLQIVPIGKPISNIRTYVLDKYLHPVPVGVKGELFIGGVGVGRGYWDQQELTAERFLPDPFHGNDKMYRTGDIASQLPDGTLCFHGRTDDQVKIRGYRVELSEIEAVLQEFPGVTDAAVILRRQDVSETLSAYITVMSEEPEQITAKLRAYLADRLPFYMLPAVITVLDAMPLTPSLKIDRLALPLPDSDAKRDDYLAPRNDIEKHLVLIWQEVLGVERVGVRDNFFALGGHSLMAVRLFTRIEEDFGQSLPLLLLFKEGTVEALATVLAGEKPGMVMDGVVSIQPEGTGPPLFILAAGLYMRELAITLGSSCPVYGLLPYENGRLMYRSSVQETAGIFYRCLTSFYPDGPYRLLAHSAYGFFAIELARMLQKNGKDVVFLGLLDTHPPNSKKQANLIDRVKIHLVNIQDKNLAEILEYLRLSAQRFVTRWRHSLIDVTSTESYTDKQIKNVRELLVQSYKPEPYDGQVTIFSASLRPWFIRWDPMTQWPKTLTGQFKIIPINGDHMSMLQPPQVTFLADEIKAILQETEVV
jgi:amino acid adenylation domain-containing protein